MSKYENKLDLRNNQVIRNMFCELCLIICKLKIKATFFSKIKDEDFNLNMLTLKMKADKTIIQDKIKYGDPPEMKIIMNEFNYSLNIKNYEMCNYWSKLGF